MPNILQGVVTKTGAMAKTITVTMTRQFEHPRFFKVLERHTKMLVHDEHAEAKIGDRVSIKHGKPFSKRKHFALASIDGRRVESGDHSSVGGGASGSGLGNEWKKVEMRQTALAQDQDQSQAQAQEDVAQR